jgi:hypothetical protein
MSERLYNSYRHLMSEHLTVFECPKGWEPILECFLEFVEQDCVISASETKIVEVKRINNTLVIYVEHAPDYVLSRHWYIWYLHILHIE